MTQITHCVDHLVHRMCFVDSAGAKRTARGLEKPTEQAARTTAEGMPIRPSPANRTDGTSEQTGVEGSEEATGERS